MRLPRRLLFIALTVACVVGFVELVALAALSLLDGRLALPHRIQGERTLIAQVEVDDLGEEVPEGGEVNQWTVGMEEEHVLHPYLGFVQDPKRDTAARKWALNRQAGDFGFPRNFHPLFSEPSSQRVVVVVVGGSVARQIGYGGNRFLQEGIARIPRFEGREVWVLALGLGGYKQPQQLMTVNYFLALGMPIDILINIDGFNEVVLPATENVSIGVNPFYPRGWTFRVEGMGPEDRRLRGEITLLGGLRRQLARVFSRVPLRYSATGSLLWRLVDRVTVRAIRTRESDLLAREAGGGSYQGRGPAFRFSDQSELYEALADVWVRSSLQMHRLAGANGIEYYHFLQPNQYDEGSKRLTLEEQRRAWIDTAPAREPVMVGYPVLRARGKALRNAGVPFFDLTSTFRDVQATVYVDACCHYSERGIRIVVDLIVAAVAAGPQSSGETPGPAS